MVPVRVRYCVEPGKSDAGIRAVRGNHSIGSAERGRYNPARIGCVKTDSWGDEHGRLRKAVGTRGIGIWVVPAVTGCSHRSRAREIGGWTGHHWSYAKSRLNSTAATLPRHAGFSRQYHHYPRGYSHIHVGGFPWPDLAGTSAEALTFRRQRRESQMEVGKAGENGG